MKKFLILVILVITCVLTSLGEVFKFKSTDVCWRDYENGEWTEYSDLVPYEVPIIINTDKSLITITGHNGDIKYKLTEVMASEPYKNGDYCFMVRFITVEGNEEGIIRLIKKKQSGQEEMYVRYSDEEIVYVLQPMK